MHKFTNTLTPAQVYRYAVECCQPHLKLRDAKRVTARMLLTILVDRVGQCRPRPGFQPGRLFQPGGQGRRGRGR